MEGEAGDKKRAKNSYTATRTLKGSDVLAAEMKEHSGKGVQGPAVARDIQGTPRGRGFKHEPGVRSGASQVPLGALVTGSWVGEHRGPSRN